jgi:Zn-dependent protease with chaperone function
MMQLPAFVRFAGEFCGMTAADRLEAMRRWIAARVLALAESHPRSYLLIAILSAVAGYGYLLLFPWLVFAGASSVYAALFAEEAVAWGQVLSGLVVAALAALASYRIARFRPALPGGFSLDLAAAPKLWQLVMEQGVHYQPVRIDRLVLTGRVELDILKTPRSCLPTWSSTTLAIGLPLMQSLSALQLGVALARRLGQCSGRYNRLENWLYRLRTIWPLYGTHSAQPGFGYQPVRWFFAAYAPVYRALTLPIARREELAADSYAMELFSDEQVLDTITTEMVCRTYLAQRYWPIVREIEAREGPAIAGFHTAMARVLRAGLRDDKAGEWLERARSATPAWDDPVPALMTRIRHIGHSEPRMAGLTAESAAVTYLATVMDHLASVPGPDSTHRPAPRPPGHPLAQIVRHVRDFLGSGHSGRTSLR